MRHPWLSFCVRPSSIPCKLTCGLLANRLSCSGSGPWIHKSGRPTAHCIPHSMSSGNTPISLARFSESALAVEFAAICCKARFRFLTCGRCSRARALFQARHYLFAFPSSQQGRSFYQSARNHRVSGVCRLHPPDPGAP